MIIKPRAVRDIAKAANLDSEFIDRNMDALIEFTYKIAKRERKFCQDKLRAWMFNTDITKPSLLDILNEDEDYDLV